MLLGVVELDLGDGIVQPLDDRGAGAGQGGDGEQGGPLGHAGPGIEINPSGQVADATDSHTGCPQPEGLVALGETGQGDRIGRGIARGMDPAAANRAVRCTCGGQSRSQQAGGGQGHDQKTGGAVGHVGSPVRGGRGSQRGGVVPLAVTVPVFVWVELTITVFQDPATETVRRLPIAVLE